MGLISICPVRRFVDGLDMPNVQAATRKLLSAFFKAMRTNTVYLAELDHLRAIFGIFSIMFVAMSCVSIAEL